MPVTGLNFHKGKHLQLINMAKIQQPTLSFHTHYLIPDHTMNIQPHKLKTNVTHGHRECNANTQKDSTYV